MIGGADADSRLRIFDWLTDQRAVHGEGLSHSLLKNCVINGQRVRLMGEQQGIWKPAGFEAPISVRTTMNSPYRDGAVDETSQLQYAYRGTDPGQFDNVGLRRAMREQIPIVYFRAIEKGIYVAAYPAFVVADDPRTLFFTLQFDDATASLGARSDDSSSVAEGSARRAYVTRTVQARMHQAAFRQRVIRAYQERCALCSLRHLELIDAAHIIGDREDRGDPVTSNGVALCKLHHAAFDRDFFAIRPDYKVEVRPSILREQDGPILTVGLQQIHRKQIFLPRRVSDRPDLERLESRYERFRLVS